MATAEQQLLLIDDDESERKAIAAHLKAVGFDVVEASDGAEGLALLQVIQPEVVLCDLSTPNIDAPGLVHALKSSETEIPVIVIARGGNMGDVVAALRFGASDFLSKPIVDGEVLEHSIERCLEQGRLRVENRKYRQQLEQANLDLQQNLKVLEQDQLAGRQVQMKMLPHRPQFFGDFQFSHRIVPSFYLSGDFVDYFTVGNSHGVFFIADVSGHGASSAFVTVLLKNMFARKRSDYVHRNDNTILSPIGMLDVANRNLLNTDIGKHATLCVGVINLAEGSLCYSVAGHLPLPILAYNGTAEYLPGEGMPVGLFKEAEYTESTLQLPEDFVLTIFTDGILEVLPGEGVLDKEKYLLQRMQGAGDNIQGIVKALKLEHVHEVPDDIAVLIISRHGVMNPG